jgi:hypothetical protein
VSSDYSVDDSEVAFHSEDFPLGRWSFQIDAVGVFRREFSKQPRRMASQMAFGGDAEAMQMFAVIGAGGRPHLVIPTTSDRGVLHQLRGHTAQPGSLQVVQALRMALVRYICTVFVYCPCGIHCHFATPYSFLLTLFSFHQPLSLPHEAVLGPGW